MFKSHLAFIALPSRQYPSCAPLQQVDSSWVFPWNVVTGTRFFEPREDVYRNLSTPRGLVLIFNFYFTGQGRHERSGAKRDSFNLKSLFQRMGYQVYLCEDFSRADMERVLTDIKSNYLLKHCDSFIVFVLSHGKDTQTFATGNGSEGECMTIVDLRSKFVDNQCPALAGKPKLFFVNFCRGNKLEPQMAFDGISPVEQSPRDMAFVYSSIDSFKAPRHPEKGTMFVQAWCKVLAEHAHDKELNELNRRAGDCATEMGGAALEFQTLGHFKKFYFNPVST